MYYGRKKQSVSVAVVNRFQHNSIHTHPEADQDRPDFEERADKAKVFSHDYWKDTWGIPTLAERKAIVAARSGGNASTTSQDQSHLALYMHRNAELFNTKSILNMCFHQLFGFHALSMLHSALLLPA